MTTTIRVILATLLLLVAAVAEPPPLDRPALRLTARNAIQLALTPEGSFRIQLAGELVKQAEARAGQARADLLPSLDGSISAQNRTANLIALGIPPGLQVGGTAFPVVVGPYSIFDARASLTQSVFNLSSIQNYKAARTGIRTATAESAHTQEQVASQVARTYLVAVRADAAIEAIEAQISLAKAVVRQTEAVKAAGMGTGIEITRAMVQLSTEQQRLLVAENERDRAYLQLRRVIGLNLDTKLELVDRLQYYPVDESLISDAESKALKGRADLQAQMKREEEARRTSSAVALERVPSVSTFADYGSIGGVMSYVVPTRAVGVSVSVPIFDGGRRDARRAEAGSKYREQRIRTNELREQIQLEVRLASERLKSAERQVQVAATALRLAEDELRQARQRNLEGVTGSLEVTTAQTALDRAKDSQIEAFFGQNQARLDLGEAMGMVQSLLPSTR